MENKQFCEDIAAFNFIRLNDEVAVCDSLSGAWICTVAGEGERWKHQQILRKATAVEAAMLPIL